MSGCLKFGFENVGISAQSLVLCFNQARPMLAKAKPFLLMMLASTPALAAAPIIFELNHDLAMVGAIKLGMTWQAQATEFPNDQVARIKKGVSARVFDLNGERGVVQLRGWKEEAPCDWNRYMDSDRRFDQAQPLYAIDAPWKLIPRLHQPMNNNDPVYLKIVQAELDLLNIKQKPLITQLLRVDLDGDRKNEVIIVAQTSKPSQIVVGDYSLVFIRKVVNEKVQAFVLDQYLISQSYNEQTGEGAMQGEKREISAIADIDGDGQMEIFVSGYSHEASWTDVYGWKEAKFTSLMSWGCGV
jgi:hypothetical protein